MRSCVDLTIAKDVTATIKYIPFARLPLRMLTVVLKPAHALLRMKAGFLETHASDLLPVQNLISPSKIYALISGQLMRITIFIS